MREPAVGAVSGRRVTVSVAAAGICSFSLLYAPQPLLPQLAAEFGLDPGAASLAVSAGTGGLAAAVLPIAVVSELVGKRPVIIASVLASAVLGLLLPFAPSYEVLLVLRVLQGVAIAGFPGVAAAYLAELLGPAGVAGAVGAMIAGNTVGGMLGRLSAGGVTEWLGWHGALAVVGGVGLLCALLTVATLPRPPRRERAGPSAARLRTVLSGFALGLRKPVLWAQYGVALLAMGSFVALYNAAGFRLTGEPLGLSPAVASLVFLCYAMGSVSSATAGRFVSRFGRMRCLLAALALTVVGAVATVADSLVVVIVGFVVFTGGFFAAHAVANGWAAAEAPPQARASASGLYTLAYYLGSSVGGTVGSVVFGLAGWGWLVGVVAVWLGCAAMGAVILARPRKAS
ncbi:arabinose efflux permease family protein [Saccharomonospora cyanea NA-134]|uniref:Arabinose efflux permease family protein n=1 Tax=Saccharomonospora cyanea NA-134 TaxID=882082 RepID=H5XIS5_9PSEU|nr:arabinose efflux permease family protein [Saccharomonospora cyanea NA-134]